MPLVKKIGYATIDVALVVIRIDETEIAIDTANHVQVAPQIETEEGKKLIKDGRILAQKPEEKTITSHQITLTDNIFYPDEVKILQGGTVTKDAKGNLLYNPPEVGSREKGQVFELDMYSAVYDEAGNNPLFEKITYPGCKGDPISIETQDNVFRLPEYIINSYAKKGQRPYVITYVKELPEFGEDTSDPVQPGGDSGSEQTEQTGLEVV